MFNVVEAMYHTMVGTGEVYQVGRGEGGRGGK